MASLIKYRTQTQSDEDFLFRLYASTRADEMSASNWDESQKQQFLRFQFNAQLHHYLNNYKNATFDIIHSKGKDIGRLYLTHNDNDIRIIDISLLPEYRGKGIGSRILKAIRKKADQQQKTIRLSVFVTNPAKRLYEKLGFVEENIEHPYIYMKKCPEKIQEK
ncbi:MAG: GNAT family N-acetyltransferase [Prolixibacteraceae bacterium]|jgi:ribosomal protein S18 acetylase RimI-like enzyme|nr:GNAT family N-acetyltransferase [Prolixibacteraceae bacterium]